MSITDVNTAPGRTPVSYPNQALTNIVNPHRQFTIIHNYYKPLQMKTATILYMHMLVDKFSIILAT